MVPLTVDKLMWQLCAATLQRSAAMHVSRGSAEAPFRTSWCREEGNSDLWKHVYAAHLLSEHAGSGRLSWHAGPLPLTERVTISTSVAYDTVAGTKFAMLPN